MRDAGVLEASERWS